MSWELSSGRGRLFALNQHHWAFHPGFKADIPYIYALVELDEGPLMSSTVIGEQPPMEGYAGLPVRIAYEDHPNDGFTLPRFELVGG
jgi:uncharacterized OB-fold protein